MYHNVSQCITMYHNISLFVSITAMRFLRRTISNKVQSIDWQYVNRLWTSVNWSIFFMISSTFRSFQIFQPFQQTSSSGLQTSKGSCSRWWGRPRWTVAISDDETKRWRNETMTKRRHETKRRLSEAQRWLAPRCSPQDFDSWIVF